jgi:m7GpppX diphosphatase
MKFQKIEILENKNNLITYYGYINKKSAILICDKLLDEDNEIDLTGNILIKNENFYKMQLKNNSVVNYYYPASNDMIESYKNKIKIVKESYKDYTEKIEPYINSIRENNVKWINNILVNGHEAERILYKSDTFIIIKNIGYDTENDFYLLAIPTQLDLKTIRDLTKNNKKMLNEMKRKSLEIAKKNNLEEEDLYFFFHYHPSCYHLHLHVCINNNKNLKFKLYRHILFDFVIHNLGKLKEMEIKFEINVSNPIYKLLKIL